jgi:hypothetical protein
VLDPRGDRGVVAVPGHDVGDARVQQLPGRGALEDRGSRGDGNHTPAARAAVLTRKLADATIDAVEEHGAGRVVARLPVSAEARHDVVEDLVDRARSRGITNGGGDRGVAGEDWPGVCRVLVAGGPVARNHQVADLAGELRLACEELLELQLKRRAPARVARDLRDLARGLLGGRALGYARAEALPDPPRVDRHGCAGGLRQRVDGRLVCPQEGGHQPGEETRQRRDVHPLVLGRDLTLS